MDEDSLLLVLENLRIQNIMYCFSTLISESEDITQSFINIPKSFFYFLKKLFEKNHPKNPSSSKIPLATLP